MELASQRSYLEENPKFKKKVLLESDEINYFFVSFLKLHPNIIPV